MEELINEIVIVLANMNENNWFRRRDQVLELIKAAKQGGTGCG